MSVHIYHPNKSNTGFACSFSQAADGTIYATLLKQSTWDGENQVGTFKDSKNDPNKNVNVKLGAVEVAAMLDCLDRNRGFSAPHDSDKQIKSISFTPWFNKVDEGEKPSQRGFSFSISVKNKDGEANPNSFFIGFTTNEGRLLREYLIFCLHQTFKQGFSPKNNNFNE